MTFRNVMEQFRDEVKDTGLNIYAFDTPFHHIDFGELNENEQGNFYFHREKKSGNGFLKTGIAARNFRYF